MITMNTKDDTYHDCRGHVLIIRPLKDDETYHDYHAYIDETTMITMGTKTYHDYHDYHGR